jgi:hypothetical protein
MSELIRPVEINPALFAEVKSNIAQGISGLLEMRVLGEFPLVKPAVVTSELPQEGVA